MADLTVSMSDLVDLAGQLSRDIKKKEKDLEKLKTAIRTHMKKEKLAEYSGKTYKVIAGDYVTSTINSVSVVKSYLGIDPTLLKIDETVTISTNDLISFTNVAKVSADDLRKEFTAASIANIITSDTKPFHVLSFKPVE